VQVGPAVSLDRLLVAMPEAAFENLESANGGWDRWSLKDRIKDSKDFVGTSGRMEGFEDGLEAGLSEEAGEAEEVFCAGGGGVVGESWSGFP
jgi:hypothetical protein